MIGKPGGIMSACVKNFAMLVLSAIFLTAGARGQKPELDAEGHPWWQHAVFYEILSAQLCGQQ